MRGLLLVLLLLSFGEVYAQPAITFPPPPSDPNKRTEMAEDYFNQAEAFYRVQDYEKALAYYKQSYLLSLQASLLFNMGQCHRQMGKHEEALKSYKSFVRDDPDNKLRLQVEKLITEEEKIIEDLKKNGNPIEQPKVIDADKDGIVDASDACLNEREDGKGAAPTDGCPAPTSGDTKPDKPALNPLTRNLYFGAAGAATGGVVFGVIAFTQAQKTKQEQESAAPDIATAEAAFKRAKTFALISDALFIAAVGVGGTGFLLQQKSKKQPEVTISIVPSGASVSVRF